MPTGVSGGFTTRAGGVSAPPYDELNLGLHVADEPRRVLANRDLLARRLGAGWVNFGQQVHGAGVLEVRAERAGRHRITHGGAPATDALVTAVPGVPLGVLVADCAPVLFADESSGVIGVAHAGRKGLVAGVLERTVEAMARLGADPARITAVIGPRICGRCYEVPEAMRDEVAAALSAGATTTRVGTPALDLPAAAVAILQRLGVGAVRDCGICTFEDQHFYSHRRAGRTGRFAGVIMLDRGR
ncbi:MAG TPA: peptidoglycan editing factor PgeF [Mycobacteriales bacterium]|nr:peptidoglycan editing factor PgeF [Mycobacteriales bacterium]